MGRIGLSRMPGSHVLGSIAMSQERQVISEAESKVFMISVVVLSAAVSMAAFWYGVFGKIFFTYLFNVWVASTAALLASLFVPRLESPPIRLPWRGRILLALPTVWLVLYALNNAGLFDLEGAASWVLWIATLASAFLTLPYLLFVVVAVAVPNIDRLEQPRLRFALIGIILAMALASFAIGKNHPLFLTCENFKIGGHDIPEDCRSANGGSLF